MLTVTKEPNKSIEGQSREVVRLRSIPEMHRRKLNLGGGRYWEGQVKEGSDREVLLYKYLS